MIAVLGGLADVERDLIRTRTAEGRSRAKARGQHMGRPPKLTPQQQKEARRRRAEGATLKELAKSYNVGRATISRLTASDPEAGAMIDFEVELRQRLQVLYEIALDFLDEDEARDLFCSITKRKRGKRGVGRNPNRCPRRRPNASGGRESLGGSSPASLLRQTYDA